ncbi:tRNA uridine 5-carbamoylmethylation protein Kti12 [Neobacillus niacini]|uniref:hypothetical protein n=1 Tax=Neobacillus niacini TaxID=86668 RepID=UPI002866A07E|nr:hypothetical protein [Neobacillus niacini]MDR7077253.1 tRNA uridine 5-carbamoylmethylation protein Kti12 [Neobacillus niacini]
MAKFKIFLAFIFGVITTLLFMIVIDRFSHSSRDNEISDELIEQAAKKYQDRNDYLTWYENSNSTLHGDLTEMEMIFRDEKNQFYF